MYLDYLKNNQEKISYSDFMLACIESTNEFNTEIFNIQKNFIMAAEGASEVLSVVAEKIKAFFRAIGKFLRTIISKFKSFISAIIDKVRALFLKIRQRMSSAKEAVEEVRNEDKFYVDVSHALTNICTRGSSLSDPSYIMLMISGFNRERTDDSCKEEFEKIMKAYTQYMNDVRNIIERQIVVYRVTFMNLDKHCEGMVNKQLEYIKEKIDNMEKNLKFFETNQEVAATVKHYEKDQEWTKRYLSMVREYKKYSELFIKISSYICRAIYSLLLNGTKKYENKADAEKARDELRDTLLSHIASINFVEKYG